MYSLATNLIFILLPSKWHCYGNQLMLGKCNEWHADWYHLYSSHWCSKTNSNITIYMCTLRAEMMSRVVVVVVVVDIDAQAARDSTASDIWWIGVRWLAVANGPNIFQMLLVLLNWWCTSVEIFSTATQLYEKLHLKPLITGEWLWRSLKTTLWYW